MNTTRLVLVFASVVLLAWEVKNECPSHMTLLYQQKLCRNNYADRRFCWLSLYHSEKPNWQQKNSSCLLSHFHSGSPMANAYTVLYPCPHTSFKPFISSFKQPQLFPFHHYFVYIACRPISLYELLLSSCMIFFFAIEFPLIFNYIFRGSPTMPWNTLGNTSQRKTLHHHTATTVMYTFKHL